MILSSYTWYAIYYKVQYILAGESIIALKSATKIDSDFYWDLFNYLAIKCWLMIKINEKNTVNNSMVHLQQPFHSIIPTHGTIINLIRYL